MMKRFRLIFLMCSLLCLIGLALPGCDDDKKPVEPAPGQWYTEFVDTAELTGYFTSVAVDAAGLPHIVYFDGTRDDLNYAYFDGSAWHLSVIDPDVSGKASNSYTTLIIDPTGKFHVAYTDAVNGDVLYATSPDGGAWDIDTVDASGDAAAYPSMDLDDRNFPYISYGKTIDTVTGLYVAFFDDDTLWTRRQLDTTGTVYFSSLAVTDQGEMHIAYQLENNLNARLCYTTGIDFVWERDTVAGPGGVGQFCSIDLNPGDVPSIAYRTTAAGSQLHVATRSGDGWTTELVDESAASQTGLFCRLLIDGAGLAHLAFHELTAGPMDLPQLVRYAVRSGGGWRIETADSVGAVGPYLALALDSQGRPHLSYQDIATADLKYAVKR